MGLGTEADETEFASELIGGRLPADVVLTKLVGFPDPQHRRPLSYA